MKHANKYHKLPFSFFCTLLLVTCLVTKSFAEANEDDCVSSEPKAEFSEKSDRISNYKVVKEGRTFLKEIFEVKDLGPVEVVQGGCAHFGQSIQMTLAKPATAPKKFDKKFWFNYVLKMLGNLPESKTIAKSIVEELKDQEKRLMKAKVFFDKTDSRTVIESTDDKGYYTVSIEVKDLGSRIVLTAAADAAL